MTYPNVLSNGSEGQGDIWSSHWVVFSVFNLGFPAGLNVQSSAQMDWVRDEKGIVTARLVTWFVILKKEQSIID